MESVHPLKAYRDERGLSQEQLAAQLGVKGASISRWEARKQQPDRDMIAKISAKTGIPPAALWPDLAELFTAPAGRRPARGRAGASGKSRAA